MSGKTGIYGLSEPALPPRPKSPAWKYIKIFLVIAALFLISLAALHRAGGNGDDLKKIVEKFLSDSSGYTAQLGKLNAVSFYPLVGVDMEDVTFEAPDKKKVARIDRLNFSTSFWSASTGESIHTLDLRNVYADAGIIAPGSVKIEQFFINPKDRKVPQLSLTGFYGDKPVMMNADLRAIKGFFGGVYFNFAEPAALDLTAGDLHATGQILTGVTGRSLKIDALSIGGMIRPVQISVALNKVDKSLGLSGKVQSHETTFDYNVDYARKDGRRVIGGTVRGDKVDLGDLTGAKGLFNDYGAFYSFWIAGDKPPSANALENTDLGLDLDIAHVISKGQDAGALKGHAKTKDGVFTVEPASKAGDVFAAEMNAYFKK